MSHRHRHTRRTIGTGPALGLSECTGSGVDALIGRWRFGALLWWTVMVVTFASPASAQVGACVPGAEVGVGPALLNNTDGDRRLGAELSASVCSTGHDLRRSEDAGAEFTPPEPFPYSWTVGADGRFSLIHDGDLVPTENHAHVRAGISVSLSKPAAPVDCPPDMPADECARRMAEVGATEFDYGFISLSGRARYESSLGFSEQNLAAGAELRYGHLRGYIPSVVITFDAVRPLVSDTRDAVGVADDVYWRWMVQGYLYHQAGPVMGEVDVGAFRANGLSSALDQLGWDDGAYVVGTLSWVLDQDVSGVFTLDRVYARVSGGQRPSLPSGGESWGVGVELGL